MRNGWTETTIGEVLTLEYGKALKADDRDGEGFPVYGSAGIVGYHSTPLVKDGPVIVVGRKGTAGSVIWSDVPCWPIDTTFWVKVRSDAVLDQFVLLALEAADLPGICAQTGVPGLNRDRAYERPVLLPPLAEQKRIVDLIGALDEVIAWVDADASSCWITCERLLAERVPDPSTGGISIESLLSRSIGGVWGSDPGEDERDVRVLRSTEFSHDGLAHPESAAMRSITEKQLQSRCLEPGDVLLEKSGGTPTRPVGRVALVGNDLPSPAVASNFIQSLRFDGSRVNPMYGIWLLWSWHRRGVPFAFQNASTNIRNLRTKEYLQLTVHLPTADEQQEIADAATSLAESARNNESLASDYRRLRSALLGDLLSGAHEIPESYDRLLERVA